MAERTVALNWANEGKKMLQMAHVKHLWNTSLKQDNNKHTLNLRSGNNIRADSHHGWTTAKMRCCWWLRWHRRMDTGYLRNIYIIVSFPLCQTVVYLRITCRVNCLKSELSETPKRRQVRDAEKVAVFCILWDWEKNKGKDSKISLEVQQALQNKHTKYI